MHERFPLKYLHGSWKPVTFAKSIIMIDDGLKPETEINRQEHHREVAHTSHSKMCSSNPETEEQSAIAAKTSLYALEDAI